MVFDIYLIRLLADNLMNKLSFLDSMARIPVYQVSVPQYQVKKLNAGTATIEYAATPWFSFRIPKAYEDNKPDFARIGAKIDACLKKHFLRKEVAVRVIGSQEHEKSIDDLVKIIRRLGHDHYDPHRKGDRYENLDQKHIDFFALDFKVTASGAYFQQFIEPFYYWPLADRKEPIRIDLAIIYDLSRLEVVEHRYKGREAEIKRDGFVFRDPGRKRDAILGIIKIL